MVPSSSLLRLRHMSLAMTKNLLKEQARWTSQTAAASTFLFEICQENRT